MPSSKDVAKKAGVSQTTVSRVLNHPESVSKATREKVQEAIEALGYIPDANARSLVSQKTHTISLISGPLHNAFFVDSTTQIIKYANQLGYKVNVHFSDGNIDDVYDMALSQRVDGLILSCLLWEDPVIYRFQKLKFPFISFNRRHRFVGNYVEMDNFEAGRLAVRHLLSYGHRHILWVGGSMSKSTFRNRYLGFCHEIEAFRSVQKHEELVIQTLNQDTSDQLDLEVMLQDLWRSQSLPSAICAATDSIAMQLMNGLIRLGVSVPKEVSIIGIDNVQMSASPLVQLSTIGVADQSQLGDIAIRQLIHMIENPHLNQAVHITKPVALFERKTTTQRFIP